MFSKFKYNYDYFVKQIIFNVKQYENFVRLISIFSIFFKVNFKEMYK